MTGFQIALLALEIAVGVLKGLPQTAAIAALIQAALDAITAAQTAVKQAQTVVDANALKPIDPIP